MDEKILEVFLEKRPLELVGSELKAIFHCSAHCRLLSSSSFSIFAVWSGSETIENKEVSSANNLTFDFTSDKNVTQSSESNVSNHTIDWNWPCTINGVILILSADL